MEYETLNIPASDSLFDESIGVFDDVQIPQFTGSNPNAVGLMAQMSDQYIDGTNHPLSHYVSIAEQEGGEDQLRADLDAKERAMVQGDVEQLAQEFLAAGEEPDMLKWMVEETVSSTDMLRKTNLERNAASHLTVSKLADEKQELYHTNEDGEVDDEQLTLSESWVAIMSMVRQTQEELQKRYEEEGTLATASDVLGLIFLPLGDRIAWSKLTKDTQLLGNELADLQEQVRTASPKEKVALYREYLDVIKSNSNTLRAMAMLGDLEAAKGTAGPSLQNALEIADVFDVATLGAGVGVRGIKGIKSVKDLDKLTKPLNFAKASGARKAAVDVEVPAAVKATVDPAASPEVKEIGIDSVLWSALKGNDLNDYANTTGEVSRSIEDLFNDFGTVLEGGHLPPRLTPDEVGDAVSSARLSLQKEVNLNDAIDIELIDLDINPVGRTNMATFSLGYGYPAPFGTKEGAEAYAARRYANIPTKIVDNGDGWIITTTRELSEKGFIKALDARNDLGKFIPGISNVTRRLAGARSQQSVYDGARAILGQNTASHLQRTFSEAQKMITRLGVKAQKEFMSVAEYQHTAERWFSVPELKDFYRTRFNREMTPKDLEAHAAYLMSNNADYWVKNSAVRAQLVRNGYRQVFFKDSMIGVGKAVDKPRSDAKLLTLYDSEENVFFKTGEVTESMLDTYKKEGYHLIEIPSGYRTEEGFAQYMVTFPSNVKFEDVPLKVLNYISGGHRYYKGGLFIKQQRLGVGADGTRVIGRPKTLWNFESIRDAESISERANKVMDAVRAADTSGTSSDINKVNRLIEREMPQWVSYTRIKEMQREGLILDTPFEIVKAGEKPIHGSEGARFLSTDFNEMDETALQAFDFHKLWFQEQRGEQLRTFTNGDPRLMARAPILDPVSALERSINQASRMFGFEDYKTTSVEKWLETYGKHITTNETGSFSKFLKGELTDGLSSTEKAKAEAWRSAIKRTILTPTTDEKLIGEAYDSLLTWMEPSSTKGLANRMRDWGVRKGRDWSSKNPITAIKGLVFDHFMALDPSQLLVQLSMFPGVMAIAGKKGLKVISAYPLLRAAMLNDHPEVLTKLAKVSEKVGGLKADQFKKLWYDMKTSGVLNIVDTQADIATFGRNSLFHNPALAKTANIAKKARHVARGFFTEAERGNKGVSYAIAWMEHAEKTGQFGIRNATDATNIAGRAEALAGNMTTASRAQWQRGLLSIPTQFQAHPFRVAELLLTDGAGFSKADKIKFMTGLTLFYGAGSIPVGKEAIQAFQEWYTETYGERPNDVAYRTMMDGLVGFAMSEWDSIPNLDISRLQTFANPDQNILFQLFFGDKTAGEVLFGPASSVAGKYVDDIKSAMWIKGVINGQVRFSDIPMFAAEMAAEVATNIAGLNRMAQAAVLRDLALIEDSKGRPIVKISDPSIGQILGTALGFKPIEEDLTYEALDFKEQFDEKVNLYADAIYKQLETINRLVVEDADEGDIIKAQRKMETWQRMIDSFAGEKATGGVIRQRIMDRVSQKLRSNNPLSENLQRVFSKMGVNWRFNDG